MLENETEEAKIKRTALLNAENAIDNIEDYTSKMFKIAQLISEDYFSHYQSLRAKNGLFDENTMIGITHDLAANNTLFEIILDYLIKVSDTARTVSDTLRDIRREDSKQEEAAS